MDQHGLAPERHIAEWLNTSEPIHLGEQPASVVVACAFQMLCPGQALPMPFSAQGGVHELFAPQGVVGRSAHGGVEHPTR